MSIFLCRRSSYYSEDIESYTSEILVKINLNSGHGKMSRFEQEFFDKFNKEIDFKVRIPVCYDDNGEVCKLMYTNIGGDGRKLCYGDWEDILTGAKEVIEHTRKYNVKDTYTRLYNILNAIEYEDELYVVYCPLGEGWSQELYDEEKRKESTKDKIISSIEQACGNIFSVTPQDGFLKIMAYNGGGHKYDLKEDKGMSKDTIKVLNKVQEKLDETIEQLYDI